MTELCLPACDPLCLDVPVNASSGFERHESAGRRGPHLLSSRAKKVMGSVGTRLILVTRVADRVAFPFQAGLLARP